MSTAWAFSTENIYTADATAADENYSVCACVPFTPIFTFWFSVFPMCRFLWRFKCVCVCSFSVCQCVCVCMWHCWLVASLSLVLSLSLYFLRAISHIYSVRGFRCDYISPFLYAAAVAALLLLTVVFFHWIFTFTHFIQFCSTHNSSSNNSNNIIKTYTKHYELYEFFFFWFLCIHMHCQHN